MIRVLAALLGLALAAGAAAKERVALMPFKTAPFPYAGENPEGKPFFDIDFRGQRGHHPARGRIYWEKDTYSDRRVLVDIPAHFDPRKPAYLVVFLHGNEATLERDVARRQQVPERLRLIEQAIRDGESRTLGMSRTFPLR